MFRHIDIGLVEFADPESVCRLSCTCKTLRSDVRDAKPWGLLAQAQLPPPKPVGTATGASTATQKRSRAARRLDKRRPQRRRSRDEADALARVRSHVRRRVLAKASPPTRRVLEGLTLQQAMARETPAEVAFTPDEFCDFTYFVRLTDGERLIWEGDLGASTGFVVVDGRELHLRLRHANLEWMGRAGHVKRGCKIALVAIRDHDQAMVSLGQFELDRSGKYGLPPYGTCYGFHRSTPLFSSARSRLHLLANLTVAQDATVRFLELTLCHLVQVPQVEDVHRNRGISDNFQFEHVLTHLAGIHHPATRASSSYTIESWFVAAERQAGWATAETRALAADIEQLERKLCNAVDLDQEDLADELADERDRLYDELDALVLE